MDVVASVRAFLLSGEFSSSAHKGLAKTILQWLYILKAIACARGSREFPSSDGAARAHLSCWTVPARPLPFGDTHLAPTYTSLEMTARLGLQNRGITQIN